MPTRPTDTNTSLALTASAVSALFPLQLAGTETLGVPGSLTLDCYSADTLAMEKAIASHVTASLKHGSEERPLDALCAEISRLPKDAKGEQYRLVLRPWLWWLTLATNNRVFQNKKTAEIVTGIFDEHGFSDYQLKLNGSYEKREYCIQYGETDFAFVSRLLEEEGIFWFFTHEKGKHTLVLADKNTAFPPLPNGQKIRYAAQDAGGREMLAVRTGQLAWQAVSDGYRATDYAFETPAASLYAQVKPAKGILSVYAHPGGYTAKARGDALAGIYADALKAQEKRFIGESDCRRLVPGHWFTLEGHDDSAMNIDWLIISVTHDATHEHYRNRFEAIPKSTAWRPLRLTPKPHMHTQTALVVGKDGEEIWTDKHGRVKIQFPWDRDGEKNESSSCWVRVALPWSGKGFGMQFIPRIGQEVIITFIDGDPDRPLVTGCVYNGENALPYALPANQTQSGIRTQSSKGGGGFNELYFEDKKDNEAVFLQAQKDFRLNVLNDRTVDIGHDDTETIKNARTRTVKEGNETVTLEKGNRVVNIQKGSDKLDVKDKREITVGGNQTDKIGGNYTLNVDGNLTIKVKGTLSLESDGNFSIDSKKAVSVKAGTTLLNEARTSLDNKAGSTLTNEAKASLTNKGASITNDAQASLTNKAGASQTVDGGGMLVLKGGLIKAN